MSESQNFFSGINEKITDWYAVNRKKVNLISVAVLALVGSYLGYRYYWVPSKEKEAQSYIYKIRSVFFKDSFQTVLKGGKGFPGAPELADDYSGTQSGKEAALMAGISYRMTGKFDQAIDYLKDADFNDNFLGPSAKGALASCYAEKGDVAKAAGTYEDAAEMSKNDMTTPSLLKMAAMHYEDAGQDNDALRCYERIAKEFRNTTDGNDIDKYIYRIKARMGEFNN
jgi:tetratricopeptide (TPR) repeat protein